MSVLNLAGQPQRITPDEDTTVFNPDQNITVLIGNVTPDTPISPRGAFTMRAGKSYWLSRADGSIGSVDLLRGFVTAIPSPVDIAASLTASGLATAIAADMIAAGVAKDSSVNAPGYGPPTHTDVITTGPANITGGKLLSDVNTTLGTPAQTLDIVTTLPANLQTSGIPPIANKQIVTNPGVQTFTAGQQRTPGPFTIKQLAIDVSITVACTAGETNPYMDLLLVWTDSVSGQVVKQPHWIMAAPASGSSNTYAGSFRARADQLLIKWKWFGVNASGNCQLVVVQTSREPVREQDFRSISPFNGIAGITSGAYDIDGGTILDSSPTIAALATQTRSLPLYKGRVFMNYANGGQSATLSVVNQAESSVSALGSSNVWQATVAANANVNTSFELPQSNCAILFGNNGSASMTPTCYIQTDMQEQ